MLRLPNARAPNSMRPCIQATIFVVVQLRHGGSNQLVHGEHVAETQLAVFEHLLDFGRGVGGAEAEGIERHALFLAVRAVPGFEHRADGGSGIPDAGCTNTFW